MNDDESTGDDPPYRICFVCSGDICRSPIAGPVFGRLVEGAGLGGVLVDSAGTGDWHIGERADLRSLRVLTAHGYPAPAHRARQFAGRWFAERELVVAFDRGHARTLRSWAPDRAAQDKVRLLRSFDPALAAVPPDSPLLDVADPYYGQPADFARVLSQVEAAAPGLLEAAISARRGVQLLT